MICKYKVIWSCNRFLSFICLNQFVHIAWKVHRMSLPLKHILYSIFGLGRISKNSIVIGFLFIKYFCSVSSIKMVLCSVVKWIVWYDWEKSLQDECFEKDEVRGEQSILINLDLLIIDHSFASLISLHISVWVSSVSNEPDLLSFRFLFTFIFFTRLSGVHSFHQSSKHVFFSFLFCFDLFELSDNVFSDISRIVMVLFLFCSTVRLPNPKLNYLELLLWSVLQ